MLEYSSHGRLMWTGLTLPAKAMGEGELGTVKETTPRLFLRDPQVSG